MRKLLGAQKHEKSAKSQNAANLCRKFITERKWMNFGMLVEGHKEGHNGCKISKISE